MSKMKKGSYLIVAVLLAFTVLFTACGQANDKAQSDKTVESTVETTEAQSSETEQPATVSNVPKDTVELQFYMGGSKQEADTDLVFAKVDEYLKDKINAKVKYQVVGWGTYDKKINIMLAAGEAMDIIFTCNWAANFRTNANSGYFTALDDYLAKYPAITEILGKDFLDGSAIEGKHYAVPTNKEKAHSWGFALKKDLAEKYGVDVNSIKTTKDLVPYFDKIKAGEPGITPLLLINMDTPYHLLDWDNLSDDDIPGALYPDGKSTKVMNQFLAPETIAYYKEMREYFEKGYIAKDAATMESNNQMKSGKFFASVSPMLPGRDAALFNMTNIEWLTLPITKPVMSNRETTGAMLAIPAASKNSERAFQFIEMLYTDKYLRNLMNYGIENEHYTVNPDGRIKLTQNGTDKYNPGGAGWKYGDQFKDILFETENPEKWKMYEEYNKSAAPLASLGFAFNKTAVENQLSSCKTVVQSYYKMLFTGSVDVDSTVAKFEKELKTAGVDEVIAEMQKQYDEWLAKKGK